MDIKTFELLVSTKSDEHFFQIFNSISRMYESVPKTYHDKIIDIKLLENNDLQIPPNLYKYMNFDGGLSSLECCNVQFSHPFSFRKDETNPLIDKSEFWFDRFYYDTQTLSELNKLLNLKFKRSKLMSPKNLLSLLQIQFVKNTAERNKILCLSSKKNNEHLWQDKLDGICIEYKSNLFMDKNNFKELVNNKNTILYNPVVYVDNIVKYPVRMHESYWLSNLLFIKNKNRFEQEEEFRVIITEDFITDYNRSKRDIFFKNVVERLEDIIKYDYKDQFKRFSFDKEFINKVYYKSSVKDEFKLIDSLDKLEIPYEKI